LDREPLTATIEGAPSEPIRKAAPGGWSQRRYQTRAENSWEHHARDIADAVTGMCNQVRAQVVAVGGDVRAVQLLEERLSPRIRDIVERVPGGRAPDGSEALTNAAVHRWVATAAARDTVALLERFHE